MFFFKYTIEIFFSIYVFVFSAIKHWILNGEIIKNLGAQGSKSCGPDMWIINKILVAFINLKKRVRKIENTFELFPKG